MSSEEIRNALGAWLRKNGVETLIHYPVPLHRQPVFENTKFVRLDLERTEIWAKTVLSLPMYVELQEDEVKYVCEKIYEFFDKGLYQDREWIKRGREWLERFM